MLNLNQSNEYRRLKRTDDLFKVPANVTIIAGYQPFADEVAIYEANFIILDNLIPNKEVLSTGITDAKGVSKEKIATDMALICKKTRAYAIKTGNTVLDAAMNVSMSEILRKKEADILPFVTTIINTISPFLAIAGFIPYGITAAKLATQLTNAQTYNATIGKADGVITTGKIANKNIDIAIKNLQVNLDMLDLLVDDFEATNPDFVTAYHTNSAVDHIGVHHSGIKGGITDSVTGDNIAGATVKIVEVKKSAVTNLLRPLQNKD